MARFFLHMRAQDHWIEDPEGADFHNLEAARGEALGAARDLLATYIRSGNIIESRRFEISDGKGTILMAVPFLDAVELTPLAYNQLIGHRSSESARTVSKKSE